MSGPLSLRLCCIATMAPALTETNGQSRIQLSGSPPPIVSDSLITKGNCSVKQSSKPISHSVDINTLKTRVGAESQHHRGLLTPIHGNGLQESFLAKNVKRSLNQLGLSDQIPDIVKQNGDESADKSVIVGKKMNQPSNGNGPNGTGRKFMKQTSLIEEKALNGHASELSAIGAVKQIHYIKSIQDGNKRTVNSTNGTVLNLSKRSNMCQTTEIASCSSKSTIPSSSAANPSSEIKLKVNSTSSSTTQNVETLLNTDSTSVVQDCAIDLEKDASRKQHLLERRSQFLLRRLRRLQGRQLESQVKTQLKSFVDFQHQNLQILASRAIRPFNDLPNTFFNSNDIKNLSTSNLVALVRKLQAPHNDKKNHKSVLVMEKSVSSESERKAGQLRTNVRHWNMAVDGEATESSSGGESCEEWEDCPVISDKKAPTPLYKRAEWKWSVDRAAIVARWTWLQAQVSDLEYRIRQQSEIYKTIRSSKGVVTLCDPPVGPGGDAGTSKQPDMSPANVASVMINVNKQASKLTQSLGPGLSPGTPQRVMLNDHLSKEGSSKSLNGYIDSQSTQTSTSTSTSTSDVPSSVNASPDLSGQAIDASCAAARCRPVRFYRKRKLLRTLGLHQASHKAARLSSVHCQCYPPVQPCPMCGGRYNNVQKVDTEGMPIMEKVSLLDPAFHPVLSFPQEIGLPLHFEALLKSGEWQSSKSQPKVTVRTIAAEKRRQKLLNAQMKDQIRKNRKRFNKTPAAVLLSSAKLRSKYEGKSPTKAGKKVTSDKLRRKELKRRRAAQLVAAQKRPLLPGEDGEFGSHGSSPQYRDGLSHSASSASLKEQKEARKKRFENAYDINNIVIPYSMAASTRVERLQYKEIQTPKWREVGSEAAEEQPSTPDGTDKEMTEEEDVSDSAFLQRHEASETDERKRFRSFVTYPPSRRTRLSRESESNALDGSSEFVGGMAESYGSSCDMMAGLNDSRRRSGSTSTSRRYSFADEYPCSSFEYQTEPFQPRDFPLPENTYEDMKKEQISALKVKQKFRRARTFKVQNDLATEFVSGDYDESENQEEVAFVPPSPEYSGSTDSNVDDFNDPEWNESPSERRASVGNKCNKR
ncbi:KAT8 regulatory NSL complex subunit 1-like isoform X2 [Mya arenaria]|uniref:KAT8 regulatory NSL complex subunit 1-like isoform X2 n=1 Tax=Mya arenaria TaxID=6604 RepID=UPI0022E5B473|nr:KAT8 regulatory NSL complex subunit 1-like isoform X2 [Mya arenaria]